MVETVTLNELPEICPTPFAFPSTTRVDDKHYPDCVEYRFTLSRRVLVMLRTFRTCSAVPENEALFEVQVRQANQTVVLAIETLDARVMPARPPYSPAECCPFSATVKPTHRGAAMRP